MRTGKGNQEVEEYEEEEFGTKKDGTSSTANNNNNIDNKGFFHTQTNTSVFPLFWALTWCVLC